MQRLTTDEQLEQIWNAAIEAGIAPVRTVDRSGDPFVIFEDWRQVEAINDLIVALLPGELLEQAPQWSHLPEERRSNPAHHIEWAIGDFGFSDQFDTCLHCYVAVNYVDDMSEDYWQHSATGELLCGNCLRANPDWGDDYLTDMAAQLEDNAPSVNMRLANPDDRNFVSINGDDGMYWGNDVHPSYDKGLTYADHTDLQRLGKAARLVDPRLQVVYSYLGGSNRIWARFNPDDNIEFPSMLINDWVEDEEDTDRRALGYAIGRAMVKWAQLMIKGTWK